MLFKYLFMHPGGGEGAQCPFLLILPGASSQLSITLRMELSACDRVLPGVICCCFDQSSLSFPVTHNFCYDGSFFLAVNGIAENR